MFTMSASEQRRKLCRGKRLYRTYCIEMSHPKSMWRIIDLCGELLTFQLIVWLELEDTQRCKCKFMYITINELNARISVVTTGQL